MRRAVPCVTLVITAAVVAAFEYGCGQTTLGVCTDNGTCAPDSGADGSNGEMASEASSGRSTVDANEPLDSRTSGDGDAGCDTAGEPQDAPCLIDEASDVFASASASPAGQALEARR